MLNQPSVTYPAYMPQPRRGMSMATIEPFNGLGKYMIPEMDPAYLDGALLDSPRALTATAITTAGIAGLTAGLAFWSYKRTESPLYAGLAFTGGTILGGIAAAQIAKLLAKPAAPEA